MPKPLPPCKCGHADQYHKRRMALCMAPGCGCLMLRTTGDADDLHMRISASIGSIDALLEAFRPHHENSAIGSFRAILLDVRRQLTGNDDIIER